MGEYGSGTFSVFTNTALETIGNSDVEDAVGGVAHKIDVTFVPQS